MPPPKQSLYFLFSPLVLQAISWTACPHAVSSGWKGQQVTEGPKSQNCANTRWWTQKWWVLYWSQDTWARVTGSL